MKKVLKKTLVLFTVVCLSFTSVFVMHGEVEAEPGYDDTEYWTEVCSADQLDADVTKLCKEYYQYQIDANNEAYKSAQENMVLIQQNIDEAIAKQQELQEQADELQTEIDAKLIEIEDTESLIAEQDVKIAAKENEIELKNAEIKDKENTVSQVKYKLKRRMAASQSSMRVNKYLDILMGASSFDELLRLITGINAITEYDQTIMDELFDLIDELNLQKEELEAAKQELEDLRAQLEEYKTDLETQKQELSDSKEEKLALKAAQEEIEDYYHDQYAEMEAKGNLYAANIDSLNSDMKELAARGGLNAVTAAAGWTFPVPGSYRSAGTWYYPSGGVHLGYDFAASVGTNVYAVGNGVVINSVNGCGTGYLTNTCGYQYGGSTGGGNQVYLLVMVNGSLYAVKYLHLLINTPIAAGTVVSAGDYIGQVGSSGNSTGPHCHIEIFYLGDASNFSNYATTWNGDLSFGCGWGYAALSRTCESGVGAPCRIRPESVFSS